jgi:hypothetical protein
MRAIRMIRVLVTLTMLALPLIALRPGGGPLASEKRARAELPLVRVAGIQYPEKFDAFFRDHFGFRERLIRWHSVLKIKALRESPVRNVVVGSDGWLFYGGYGDGIDISDFSGRWPYREVDVDAWLRHQDERRAEYALKGARYLIVLVPNKHTLYAEHVPLRYGPQRPGVLDAVLARAKLHPDLDILDLRSQLRSHREGEPLYYRSDTHWNGNGAFVAAAAVVEAARSHGTPLAPLRRQDYEVRVSHGGVGDLATMLAVDDLFADDGYAYRRRDLQDAVSRESDSVHQILERPATPLPRLVLLGDSFGEELAVRLADAASRLHYLYSARTGPNPALVASEKPDLVVLVLVERYLEQLGAQ